MDIGTILVFCILAGTLSAITSVVIISVCTYYKNVDKETLKLVMHSCLVGVTITCIFVGLLLLNFYTLVQPLSNEVP